MNYYEHHLGDYMRDTAHLSITEDGAYRRLLDAYYIRERALPVDLRECYKLARAGSKLEREAVAYVLGEFFQLEEDGYHQRRADEEIERYHAKEPEREARRQNDAERQRRARERRKVLFDQLRGHDIVPPFDTKTADLERLLSQVESRTESREQSRPVTRDNTATQSPVPRHQKKPSVSGRGSRLPPDWDPGESGFAFAAQQGLTNGKAQGELAKFRDYWTAKAGADATKADWQATWRNWVRKAVEHGGSQQSSGSSDIFAGAR